jgi:DNA-binding IscR family transcriptional regulator
LVRLADQISVGEVLSFMEDGKRSKRTAPDAFTHLWKTLDASIASVIDLTTFADLVRDWQEAQTDYVPNWQI